MLTAVIPLIVNDEEQPPVVFKTYARRLPRIQTLAKRLMRQLWEEYPHAKSIEINLEALRELPHARGKGD